MSCVSNFFFLLVFVICHTASVEALNWVTLEAKNLSEKKNRDERGREADGKSEGWKEKCGNPDR